MDVQPLISCLLVTPANDSRWPLLQRSLADYCTQTYQPRELVIVVDNPSQADEARLRQQIAKLNRLDIRIVIQSSKISLGALRNASVRHANAPILCQWDDDDINGPRRLELQVGEMIRQNAGAAYLQNVPHVFLKTKEVYWVNWAKTKMQGHPGTLMYRKEHVVEYPESGATSERGEDAEVLFQLRRKTKVAFFSNPADLYIYVYHGHNTFDMEHHKFLASRFCEPREYMTAHRAEIQAVLNNGGLPSDALIVMDQRGVAWSWRLRAQL
jgi:glycosyltransferase involved in cell wall biosynthesis